MAQAAVCNVTLVAQEASHEQIISQVGQVLACALRNQRWGTAAEGRVVGTSDQVHLAATLAHTPPVVFVVRRPQ